jgi:excisionase family DNA binding protein
VAATHPLIGTNGTDFTEESAARLQRVQAHIEELRRAGRTADADAVAFVRDVAEQALAGQAEPPAGKQQTARRRVQPRDLLTTGDAGLALGISDQTVRNWVAAGRLPAVKRGVRNMIPREAVIAEIERSRVLPPQPEQGARAQGEEAAILDARRELLAALPRDTVEQLNALHQRLQDGQQLTPNEEAERIRLEREMADAAARHLQRIIRRGRVGAE